ETGTITSGVGYRGWSTASFSGNLGLGPGGEVVGTISGLSFEDGAFDVGIYQGRMDLTKEQITLVGSDKRYQLLIVLIKAN
ncbi:MAG: hypothetical protein JRJ59_06410, partial [Deltaproteobacteria bacterium]|nr:hypothetical protein [Deltaproteobacteria bacterium]